ncbi:MAG TPA: hypothetical protein VMS31_09710 [Pyrinomonadaceae bacterium]|nr:hypothetical protein [Pyrinomonadaceae bacterium]
MHKLTDALRTGILLLAAVSGIVVSVFDLVGHPLSWVNDIPSVTLILIGLIAVDLSLERFTSIRRIEQRLEGIEGAKELNDQPLEKRELIKRSIQHYIDIQKLKHKSRRSNLSFCHIADEILEEHVALLNSLATGRLNVPNDQIPAAHGKMSSYYKERLDAVSETDLDFWSDRSSIAEEYFKRNVRAVRNNTILTRIFIFSIPDLLDRSHEVIAVLERHYRVGMGWGVAILEELEYEVVHSNVPLDFALYNRDKAVSFFRKQEAGRFEGVFLPYEGHENEIRIINQREVYKKLIAECWLANHIFKEQYPGALTPVELAEVVNKTSRYNRNLSAVLGPQIVEDDTFVLLANNPGAVESKVKQLSEIVMKWRKVHGYHHSQSPRNPGTRISLT